MSSLQEIELAIRNLSSANREQLLRDLPALCPELEGEAAWERIISDARPRPALTALLDQVDATLRENPNAFAEIKESDFGGNS